MCQGTGFPDFRTSKCRICHCRWQQSWMNRTLLHISTSMYSPYLEVNISDLSWNTSVTTTDIAQALFHKHKYLSCHQAQADKTGRRAIERQKCGLGRSGNIQGFDPRSVVLAGGISSWSKFECNNQQSMKTQIQWLPPGNTSRRFPNVS